MTAYRSLSQSDAKRLRKLEQALAELREGTITYFSITKLTSIKSLCKDDYLRTRYCLYLSALVVGNAQKHVVKGGCKEANDLIQESGRAIIGAANHDDNESARRTLQRIIEYQDETEKVKWTTVRIIKNRNLLVLENLLHALSARTDVALDYIYDATKHYVEKYNPHYGTGLIVDSIPMLEQIIDFWKLYECRERSLG